MKITDKQTHTNKERNEQGHGNKRNHKFAYNKCNKSSKQVHLILEVEIVIICVDSLQEKQCHSVISHTKKIIDSIKCHP